MIGAVALAALPFVALAQPAAADESCMYLPDLLDHYAAEYGEKPAWSGVSVMPEGDGDLLILASPDGGTWSIFRMTDGVGCLVDYGMTPITYTDGGAA